MAALLSCTQKLAFSDCASYFQTWIVEFTFLTVVCYCLQVNHRHFQRHSAGLRQQMISASYTAKLHCLQQVSSSIPLRHWFLLVACVPPSVLVFLCPFLTLLSSSSLSSCSVFSSTSFSSSFSFFSLLSLSLFLLFFLFIYVSASLTTVLQYFVFFFIAFCTLFTCSTFCSHYFLYGVISFSPLGQPRLELN